jgi:hypothetical protein
MTLILAQRSWVRGLHVVDRLVSAQGIAHDRNSNKTIIYRAPDSVVAISYTGLAYIGPTPTDVWLAELITGRPLDDPMMCSSFGVRHNWPPIQAFLDRAIVTLNSRTSAGRWTEVERRVGVELLYSGWQWDRRGRSRPIVGSIRQVGGAYVHEPGRRHLQKGAGDHSVAPAEYVTDDLKKAMNQAHLGLAGRDAIGVLVAGLRTVHQRHPTTVGADCLGIFLRRPSVNLAAPCELVCEFWTAEEPAVEGTPVTFVPWIIERSFIQAPAALNFGRYRGAGLSIEFVVPRRQRRGTGPIVTMNPQARPRRP